MSLKSLKKSSREDTTLQRLVETLVGTISSIVHEMTEDTRSLGEIKLTLDEFTGNNNVTEENSNSVFVKNFNCASSHQLGKSNRDAKIES
jgi:hypothetical protein